jgi:hypothetical protein
MAEGNKAAERCQVIQGKQMVMAEERDTHLWTTAILVHEDLQLQRLILSHLDDVADSKIDFLGR